MSENKEREAFEDWWSDMPLEHTFDSGRSAAAWSAWQARAALTSGSDALGEGMLRDLAAHGIAVQRVAPADFLRAAPAPVAAPASMTDEMRAFIEGMSVSVDVSTGEHDAGNRYYGFVTEVMDDPDDKHGVTLLVQSDVRPNFKIAAPASGEAGAYEAPYYIETSHENDAYVTLAFSGKDARDQFIKATRYGRNDPTVPALSTAAHGMSDEQFDEIWNSIECQDLQPLHPGFERALRLRFARAILRAAPAPVAAPASEPPRYSWSADGKRVALLNPEDMPSYAVPASGEAGAQPVAYQWEELGDHGWKVKHGEPWWPDGAVPAMSVRNVRALVYAAPIAADHCGDVSDAKIDALWDQYIDYGNIDRRDSRAFARALLATPAAASESCLICNADPRGCTRDECATPPAAGADDARNAARYRWLRDSGDLPQVLIDGRWYGTQHRNCLDMDAAIDAALRAGNQGETR